MALEDEDAEPETLHGSSPGGLLGERYQIREVLGRGGMGEVYRAFDVKLRVDVALKAVREELSSNERARELLRQEVRSAREVVSPNVCRIYDLVVEDGRELVSMEYIDGRTLAETLRERGPLELREAREIAAQFLSGLEAIHEAGLVHRDFKPENVMLTRAGRVVVMDFGLAKSRTEGKSRTIAGTPAYMSPEQTRGEPVDARSDVFSAGVVLSEMLWTEARGALWSAVRESPPRVPEGAWAPVLRQALAVDRESRQPTARALARALDEVTHRLPGFEDRHPYPGLSSFTQEDAEYFFGREMEVEALWKKMKRPRLLALIGPSGAGKSSFLRAGLLPTLPPGWRVILSTPGSRPFSALAQALIPSFAGDLEALQLFPGFEKDTAITLLSKWRHRAEHALVIVDQFEELFTLNPKEVQEAFATLLGRLVLEADVHVLVSLRDDFLFHCQKHDALSPVFSELTPLGTLSPSALRRALVQPALACGYRFEDEALVEEMVSEVSRERGVLPLLAFAASRLWEKRDREKGLLTREAYREIGGVGGALAQHAEETLDKIGAERTPIVRELFRNLVTAEGTRASREVEELLSIFSKEDERIAAAEVLRELIAARLLTSYEDSVEIIHESLLTAWPRLVQWRNQDEGGALLRDQLRQAAQAWHDRGRPEDLLWTGRSYRELSLWREAYAGGLSATEEAFAAATTSLAGRRRRRRRIAVAASFALLLGVMGSLFSLWRRSVLEVSRREAAQILALGRVELEDRPTAALAHALASLERADSEEARRFAVEALWHGAAAFVLPEVEQMVDFSPDGRWLASGGIGSGVRLWSREGGPPRVLAEPEGVPGVRFGPASDFLAAGMRTARFWSIPDGRELSTLELEGSKNFTRRGTHLFSLTPTADGTLALRDWHSLEQLPDVLASHDVRDVADWDIDGSGEWLITARARGVYLTPLRVPGRSRLVGEHDSKVVWVASQRTAPRIASVDERGEVRVWKFSDASFELERSLHAPGERAYLDPTGRWLVVSPGIAPTTSEIARLWDLTGPPDAEPLALRNGEVQFQHEFAFHPEGLWLATAEDTFGILWPLLPRYARVLRSPAVVGKVLFAADGRSLVTGAEDGTVRLWPLSPRGHEKYRVLMSTANMSIPAVDPTGTYVLAAGTFGSGAALAALESGTLMEIPGVDEGEGGVISVSFSRDGQLAAVAGNSPPLLRIWDVDSGGVRVLDPKVGHEGCAWNGGTELLRDLEFLPDGRLLTSGTSGVRVWELGSGSSEEIRPCGEKTWWRIATSRDSRTLLLMDSNPDTRASTLGVHDLQTGSFRAITTHGNRLTAIALDGNERVVVTGDLDGVVRVGPITGEEPHLLYGHEHQISSVAVSPDGKWIASGSQDGTIRLWPMPEGTPFHTLPYEEILERIRGLTNLRVVADASSGTGYRVDVGTFPGWKSLPVW
jgi:WD40 repeat protein/predicted Ser/Thr protein kinase